MKNKLVLIIVIIAIITGSYFIFFYSPKSECQIDCRGKKCGAIDNCGNTCDSANCISPSDVCKNKDCTDVLKNTDEQKNETDSSNTETKCKCPNGSLCKNGICCDPNCDGKNCGDDGCGGVCGICQSGSVCRNGICCDPNCHGKNCGELNDCGHKCDGPCPNPFHYCLNKTCVLKTGSEVGNTCDVNTFCPLGYMCNRGTCCDINIISPNLTDGDPCKCFEDCTNKNCGKLSGCGLRVCKTGLCPSGQICINGICQTEKCIPNCVNKDCGDDGCGGSCGECNWALAKRCINGQCKVCLNNCFRKFRGESDGCGGICTPEKCLPDCTNKNCGDNGCGGVCGTCLDGRQICENGTCKNI